MVKILLIIAYIIEPVVWICLLNLVLEKKYKNNALYIGYVLLDVSISLINEFTNISSKTGEWFFSVIFFCYATVFVCTAYKGKTYKKMLYAGALLMLSLTSDIIVLIGFTIFGVDTQKLSEPGIYNSCATMISKCIMYLLGRKFFGQKRKFSKEFMPMAFSVAIMELPSVVVFKNREAIKNNNVFLITYMISQMAAGFLITYIKRLFDKRKIETADAVARARAMEAKAEEMKKRAEAFETKSIVLEERLNDNGNKMLEFFENRKKILINPDDILYAERVNRKVLIATNSGEHEVRAAISSLEKELGYKFLKINQGTIINKKYIEKTDGELLWLKTGVTFHIARERSKEIKEGIGKEMIR